MLTTKGSVILTAIVLAVVGVGVWRWWPTITGGAPVKVPTQVSATINDGQQAATATANAQAATAPVVATTKESVPSLLIGTNEARLTEAKNIPAALVKPNYVKTEKNGKPLVRFPYNIWPGWSPIIVANNGTEPNENSLFYKKYGFYVEMILVDDPVRNRDLFASGENPIMWGTLDMIRLFADSLMADSRSVPLVPMQIDFSSGGDGIVARNGIKNINDLKPMNGKRKKGVMPQNSPSHFLAWSLISDAGIDPVKDIDWRWAADAPSAAKIFVSDKSFDFFVGWSPDIYNVEKIAPESKIIMTTHSANKRIADVWAVRSDFYAANKQLVINLVDGILEGVELVRKDPSNAAALCAAAFGLPVEDCKAMIGDDGGINTGDAHLVNYRENANFFLNDRNPANFETVWKMADAVYAKAGSLTPGSVNAAQIKLTEPLRALAAKWKDSKDLSVREFTPEDIAKATEIEGGAAISKAIRVQFERNSFKVDPAYDPTIPATVQSVVEMIGSFGSAVIVVEGNTDASKRGQISEDLVRDFSLKRAEAVRSYLLTACTNLNPKTILAKGNGWSKPVDISEDVLNAIISSAIGTNTGLDARSKAEIITTEKNKLNRRVEVAIYPVEG